MAATALVLGVNGQDGSYAAESFLRRGISVVGIGRDLSSRYVQPQAGFDYRNLDLVDIDALARLIADVRPDFAVHAAAVHGAADSGFTYEAQWRTMMQVNVLTLHPLLEHARLRAPHMRILYAGSSKVFPAPLSGLINEATPMRATCLYGIGKLAARDLILEYRRSHKIAATNLVLFNHDSARRRPEFFLPQIASAIERAHKGLGPGRVRTLDFRIDWSAADEIMDQVVELALKGDAEELVVASGRTVEARQVVSELFARDGLDYSKHITEELPPHDPGPDFSVDVGRLAAITGYRPKKTPSDIVDSIIAHRRLKEERP